MKTMVKADCLWAKLQIVDGKITEWHSLISHSADVAAVVKTLLDQPTIRRRFATLAGLSDLDPVICNRFAALAFLHDIGKANSGFQARADQNAKWVGHIDELSWLLHSLDPLAEELISHLGLERMEQWFTDEMAWPFLEAIFAHHGRPWKRENLPLSRAYWIGTKLSDPIQKLTVMREKLDLWFTLAFGHGPILPNRPELQHAFAGLVMLADWIGSDTLFFPFSNGDDFDRFPYALEQARIAIEKIGLAVETKRAVLRAKVPGFEAAFGFVKPRPLQSAMENVKSNLLVLEAETGSGKTEAALWRFKLLFEQGLVDGLYFALPTRVAATQIFERVKAFRDRIFPEGERPGVVLAVPGQARYDEAEVRPLPGFAVQWNDQCDRTGERWAAERPKRFLAATIAVGTIDQALLGAVRIKHAHLRGTALLRQFLVVDEVHASQIYAGALLRYLLQAHIGAGGHALLLSATLGSAMRAHLLGTQSISFERACALSYPALSFAANGHEVIQEIASDSVEKSVAIDLVPIMREPNAIAECALAAARNGAAVLIIRNTVGAAIETSKALEELAGQGSALLFRVCDVPAVHHARFAVEDRRLLDMAVEDRLGKARPVGDGTVVIGSQTLEISLDLDADLLITDLCPMDVLLQRIGRLHRHSRKRPEGYKEPRVLLLVPPTRDILASKLTRYGLGPLDTTGRGIYPDLRIIEATWRLAEQHVFWIIPRMNRFLVEAATHADKIAAIEAENPALQTLGDQLAGRDCAHVQTAQIAHLDRTKPFDECVFPHDEHFGTRLGMNDRVVTFDRPRKGPFGLDVTTIRLPGFLAEKIPVEALPEDVFETDDRLTFRLGKVHFSYGRFGLLKDK